MGQSAHTPTEAAMNAIEAVKHAEHEAKLKAAAEFQTLAERLAKGEPLPDGVLSILVAANKTADDLEKAVAVAAERQQLKPLAESLPQILSDRAKAEADLKAADEAAAAELDRLREVAVHNLAPLHKRVAELREAEQQSRSARSRLQHLDRKPDMARKFALTGEDE